METIDKTTLVKCDRCDGTGETPIERLEGDCCGCLGNGTRETLTFLEMVETLRALDTPEIEAVEYDGKEGDIHGHAFVRLESGRSISLKRGDYTMGEAGLFEVDTPLRREPYGRQSVEDVIGLVRASVSGDPSDAPYRAYET